jgi:hypothetical protein
MNIYIAREDHHGPCGISCESWLWVVARDEHHARKIVKFQYRIQKSSWKEFMECMNTYGIDIEPGIIGAMIYD